MAVERALNLPLSGREKKDIILNRLSERLDRDCVLMDSMCHNGMSYKLTLEIKLSDMTPAETLVWDQHTEGEVSPDAVVTVVAEQYQTESPNLARQENGLDLPIEVKDAKGQSKVKFRRVKGEAA